MNILVVDDELGLRHTLTLILQAEGHEVRSASDGASALERLAEGPADLIVCDVRMPGLDGLTFLERYQQMGGSALVLMMSAYGDDEAALEAIRRGAYDFIPKPFRADQVLLVVRKAIEREGLRREVAQLHDELVALRAPTGIVGRSPKIAQALALADKVARHPSTVLVTGESGTGKELIARHIHDASPRASRPFVAVNCAAIPEALLESELFGHAKGAFTGAIAERQGLFEEAHEGTLFLDELGDLPVPLQVKLLRALQEGEVRRVGDNASRSVDVRLVAATARDLESDVAEGRFRADLYYRVNVVRIHLPALRERAEDVPELVRHFVDRFNRRLGLHVTGVSAAAMRALVEYPWPGNVRELENVIERAMVLTDGPQVGVEQLPTLAPPAVRTEGGVSPLDLSVKRRTEELERALISEALARTRGNRTRAAKLLDLSHRALLYKIRDYGLGE
ncbi:MAG TPA: sigma-54 dependent transcriptional regulator [Gemmatimonadaceae bacterium]|jgi:two-component system response regulator AtoC|nr:sigma-54 dependent transcriptional regulator [Gemmatimonadaceae bacterium]